MNKSYHSPMYVLTVVMKHNSYRKRAAGFYSVQEYLYPKVILYFLSVKECS